MLADPTPTELSAVSIAVNRFGYGARQSDRQQACSDPVQWLKSQLVPISFSDKLPDSNDIFNQFAQFKQRKKSLKSSSKNSSMGKQFTARHWLQQFAASTVNHAIGSPHSVSWRLFDFFSNHFSVSANGRLMTGLAPTLEREAIAPHLLGKFEDMLLAVEQHPAMLVYLNNERSVGPNSTLAKKTAKRRANKTKGLNENLAREILELHTLGVNGGYQQADVVELAKGISGWSVKNPDKEGQPGFVFRQYGHEPGSRQLMGIKYPANGLAQGQQMLKDLAAHPATARHLCFKLAQYFVTDQPSMTLLNKMTSQWHKTQGNIKQVMLTLFENQQDWIGGEQKFKTPRDFVISCYRLLAKQQVNGQALVKMLTELGQPPFNADSPSGFSNDSTDWLGGSALMARIDLTAVLVEKNQGVSAKTLMNIAFGDDISEHTYRSVIRAESRQQSLMLLLMSPEFQRR